MPLESNRPVGISWMREISMQKRSADTHEKILRSASQLFAKNGYSATGVAAICKKANISKGAFYHHFPSKQDVFLALLENWLTRLETGFKLHRQQSKDIPQAIMRMAESVGYLVQDTDVQLSLILEFWTQAIRDPEIWQIAIAPYRRFQQYFADLIHEGIRENSFEIIDPELGANVIVSLALGMLLQGIFDPNSISWEAQPSKSLSLLLNGMLRRKI